MSIFSEVPKAPVDPVFGVRQAYLADTSPNKVDLGIGAYRDDDGKPWVLPTVREAEKQVFEKHYNHEYLNIDGLPELWKGAAKVTLGEFAETHAKNIASIQALSGTGSLRLAAEFFQKYLPGRAVYVSIPTWSNHFSVFKDAGLEVKTYKYFHPSTLGLDYDGLIADFKAAPEGSVMLLHACAHNPTGVDPTPKQWEGIFEVMKERKLFPFFDSAYQGFATGDLERDAFSIRYFAQKGVELMIAQSFAKNFGLYGERVGALHVVTAGPDQAERVGSQLKAIARANYSNPPSYGARVIATVLGDPKLIEMWKQDMKTMSGRIIQMRQMLFDELKKLGIPGDWSHILNQIGMFTFTGLNEVQVEKMTKEHHIYMLKTGRISMCGATTHNVAYIAQAIHAVVTGTQAKV